jgi:hypothetical protein
MKQRSVRSLFHLIVPFFFLLLSSCVFSGFVTVPRAVPFDESRFAAYRGSGSGVVTGQLIVTADDGVHIGSGDHVTLIPVTAYTREMVDREIVNGDRLAPSDPRFKKYVRLTTTDDNGNFAFHQLPPGEYFVSGLAEWYFGSDAHYQWGCERISVGRGQSVRVKVSHNLNRPEKPLLVVWAFE